LLLHKPFSLALLTSNDRKKTAEQRASDSAGFAVHSTRQLWPRRASQCLSYPTTYGMRSTRAAIEGLSAEIKHKDNAYSLGGWAWSSAALT
jgi:hypothetical protein